MYISTCTYVGYEPNILTWEPPISHNTAHVLSFNQDQPFRMTSQVCIVIMEFL